jgi:predicted HicB family RNase H-like nuclease
MTYLLRGIEPDLWRRVKSKAALEGVSVNALILRLLREWVG